MDRPPGLQASVPAGFFHPGESQYPGDLPGDHGGLLRRALCAPEGGEDPVGPGGDFSPGHGLPDPDFFPGQLGGLFLGAVHFCRGLLPQGLPALYRGRAGGAVSVLEPAGGTAHVHFFRP